MNKKLVMFASALVVLMMPYRANADVMSSSMVNITDFQILCSDGLICDAATDGSGDFSALTFTSSADMDVSFTSLDGLTTIASDDISSSAAPIDFAPICVGDCPVITDNSFPKLTAPPGGNYATADQLEEGAPVDNLAGFPDPATVANASYAGLDSLELLASANSNNNLNSSFIFTLEQSQGLTFEFNADSYLQVAVTADEVFPGFATAAHFVEFTITALFDELGNPQGGVEVWSFAPDGTLDTGENNDPFDLNNTLSLNAPIPSDLEFFRDSGGALFFSATTPLLQAGWTYQLSARLNTNADVQRINVAVPEPGIIALLGMGLFGMSLVRRRRT